MPEHARAVRSTRTAPAYPRRVSGPSRRPALAGVPAHRGRTSAFEKLSRVPDHRVVDRLLRGRACILLIGLMLGGIVAMQVSLLRLNTGISRAVQTQDTLVRQNASLQQAITASTSGEKVAAAAAALNMVEPPAGETRYLTARPGKDEAPRGQAHEAAERAGDRDHGQQRHGARHPGRARLGGRRIGRAAQWRTDPHAGPGYDRSRRDARPGHDGGGAHAHATPGDDDARNGDGAAGLGACSS